METGMDFFALRLVRYGLLASLMFACSIISGSEVLVAQDKSERDELVDQLNQAKSDLQTSGNDQSVPLDDPSFGTVSLKDFRGGCRDVFTGEVVSLVHLNDEEFLMLHQLKTSSEIDIPVESDILPCQLNDWLRHCWVGWQNQRSDSGRNEGFDDHCTDGGSCPACELFYVRKLDPNDNQDKKMLPNPWYPPDDYSVRLALASYPYTESQMFISPPSHLFYTDNQNVVIGYRKQPESSGYPDTNLTRRSHFKMLFDYTKVPAGYDYVYKPGTSYYLRSIELSFQIRSYGSSPSCSISGVPSSDPDLRPYLGSTRVIMEIGYSTTPTGAVSYVTCESLTPAAHNGSADEANQWLWKERNEWSSGYGFHNVVDFHIDKDGFLYLEFKNDDDWTGEESFAGLQFYLIKLQSRESPAEYCEAIFPMEGMFCVDDMTGDLVYYHESPSSSSASCPCTDCFRQLVVCLDFCEPLSGDKTLDNVITASARTFADEWNYDPAATALWPSGYANIYYKGADNRMQRGEDAMWRLEREFIYRSRIKSGIDGNKIYDNAGVFIDNSGNTAGAFTLYNWRVGASNDPARWLHATTVMQYSPSGEAVEERDVLGIYSTAHFTHANTVPKLVAANAEYETVGFEAFEDKLLWKDNANLTTDYAHSGSVSYKLNPEGTWSCQLTAVDISSHIVDSGLIVKVWVKRSYDDPEVDPEDLAIPYTPISIKIGSHTYSIPSSGNYGTLEENVIHKVAQTGEWTQYQLLARDFAAGELVDEEDVLNDLPILVRQNLDNSFNMWIDDIRVQPYDAQMVCYVYDRDNLRLLTTFDDQHFGSYYQYNGEGRLVRTLRETERGLKTVAETQYHSAEIERYDFVPAGPIASISSRLPSADNFSGSSSLASGSAVEADLMSLQIGPEGPKFDFFKSSEGSLTEVKSIKSMDLQQKLLDRLSLPEVDTLLYLSELQEIEKEIEHLNQQSNEAISEEMRLQFEEKRNELEERKKKIIEEKLGISEYEWNLWYQETRALEDGSNSNTED